MSGAARQAEARSDDCAQQRPAAVAALTLENLSVGYRKGRGPVVQVVQGVDLTLRAGLIHGLVGESGCGKSTVALASIGYRGHGSVILAGRALLADRDLLALDRSELGDIWGRDVAYLAQNAATALDPALTIRTHFDDVLRLHVGLRGADLSARRLEMLEAVGLPDPAGALRRYPHEFSGGQQQRLALAIALACRPKVLILDEPTTGLDVTTQARVSELLTGLVVELGIAALYVSHDIALLATVAADISVMYGGEIVERGLVDEIAASPRHPYTRALLAAVPSVRTPRLVVGIPGGPPLEVSRSACPFADRCGYVAEICRERHPEQVALNDTHTVCCARLEVVGAGTAAVLASDADDGGTRPSRQAALLELDRVSCFYATRGGRVAVVSGVSFEVGEAETVGVVGLSGSGKSTLLRAIAGLHPRVAGQIRFRGEPLVRDAQKRPRAVREHIQIVFQDPASSLNPRHRVGDLIARPIALFRAELTASDRRAAVAELLDAVKLSRSLVDRYPWELSGGQQQRVAVARAFAAAPALLLCDEITSALDVSVQATIIELVRALAAANGTAIVFVSHDLAVVRSLADRVIVMRDGEICESAATEELFAAPAHPYTIELLSAIPDIGDALDGGQRAGTAMATGGPPHEIGE